MFWTKVQRVIKAGFVNFWRNGWISVAAVLIMVIALFTIGSLIFSKVVMGTVVAQIQDKVDINIYFKTDAKEENIFVLKDAVAKLPEVKAVEYISAEQNLANYKEKHKDNATMLQAVEELDSNPLGATLNVRAKEPSQYESVAKFLEGETSDTGESIIYKVNYNQNKLIIERLDRIINAAKKLGSLVSIFLAVVAILVIFNTIHLAIYSSKEEIGVMKLVGASGTFVSAPFIVEGVMYGVIASIIVMVVYYPLLIWLGPITENFFSGINLFEYYISNFGQIFLTLLGAGVLLGAISSFIAVRRYLKV